MSAITQTLSAIGSILGGIAGILGVTKEIEFPELPTFKIPEEDLETLTKQIEANTAISEEARKAAIEALRNFNMGKLSPAYEALYNDYARKRVAQVQEELAARGFAPGSTEYNRVMGELAKELNAYRAGLLRTQLEDALALTGLSETTINELYNKWRVQSGIVGAEAETKYRQAQLGLEKYGFELGRTKAIGEALSSIAGGLEDILAPKPKEVKTEPIPEAKVPKPEESLERYLRAGKFKVEVPEVKSEEE